MNNVVDIRPYIKFKLWLTTAFNDAWTLHDKYAEQWQTHKQERDLEEARVWFDVAMGLGNKIDEMGGFL
jgi:hypothetical protein